MKTLRVVDWPRHFENNRTKPLKYMTWVPVPTKQDGDGYCTLVNHPNGAAHLGCWLAILEIAAKCEPRGTLLRDSRRNVPHTPQSLAVISRLPARLFEEVIPRLLEPEIGWLEEVAESKGLVIIQQEPAGIQQEGAESMQEPAGIQQQGAPSRARGTRNSTERNSTGETRNRIEQTSQQQSQSSVEDAAPSSAEPAGLPCILEALKSATAKTPTEDDAKRLWHLASRYHPSAEVLACYIARIGEERRKESHPIKWPAFFDRAILEDYQQWLKENQASVTHFGRPPGAPC